MRRKIYSGIVVIFLSILHLSAQFFNNYDTSIQDFIVNSRKEIFSLLGEENFDDISLVIDSVEARLEYTEYQGFWVKEKMLLNYFTGNHNGIISDVHNFDSLTYNFHFKLVPPGDELSKEIIYIAHSNFEDLVEQIKSYDFMREEQDFLIILLQYLLNNDNVTITKQDSLNKLCEIYLISYPHSKFQSFINKHLYIKYTKETIHFGFSFFGGYLTYTGRIKEYISGTDIYGFDLGIVKNNITANFELGMSNIHQIERTFEYNDTWTKGMKVNMINPEIQFGYTMLNRDRLLGYPFIAPSIVIFVPYNEDATKKEEYENYRIGPNFVFSTGINLNYLLTKEERLLLEKKENAYLQLNLQLCYHYPFLYNKNNNLTGGYVSLKIGIGRQFNSYTRDYMQ